MIKKIWIISIFITLTLVGCMSSQEKNKINMDIAKNWLNKVAGTPGMNIDGQWYDTAFGSWGSPIFTQTGNEIIGSMGLYNVQGRMNNNKIYLIATSSGRIYYTLILSKINRNSLKGKYIYGLNMNENFNGTRFILKRSVPQSNSFQTKREQIIL